MPDQIVLIFVKNPELGKVKTRLAATVGDTAALEIYKKLLGYTQQVTAPLLSEKQVWFSAFTDENSVFSLGEYLHFAQVNGDLGQKMSYAFKQAFERGCKKVVIIGSDCAELKTSHLEEAFRMLERKQVVIGPAKDGGYYLLGMNAWFPELLQNIAWSTSAVGRQTREQAELLGLQLVVLEVLSDVDTYDDWQQVASKFKKND